MHALPSSKTQRWVGDLSTAPSKPTTAWIRCRLRLKMSLIDMGCHGSIRTPSHFVASIEPITQLNLAASPARSEEHTSELQSLMRHSYAVFCLQKTTTILP